MRSTCQIKVVVIVLGSSFMLCCPRRGAGRLGVGKHWRGRGVYSLHDVVLVLEEGRGVEWLSKSDDMCFSFFATDVVHKIDSR